MRDNLELETDKETLKELSTFIKHPGGKSAAANGSHDDLVMASAIAHQIGQDYDHEIQIIDTGSNILNNSFSIPEQQEYEFMEW